MANCRVGEEGATGVSASALVARPAARLILTGKLLERLKSRAAANEASWVELTKRCDDYANGSVYPPGGNAYPSYPNVGQGYQGEEYLPVIRSLGLCYRLSSDTNAQARYGAAGSRVLEAMSTPVSEGGQKPSTDNGYGVRNYVVGMALGYDWLYPALSSSTKQRVVAAIDTWIDWYDQSGFIRDQPIGNYFAGYFLAKTTAALATQGENAQADAYWNDVETHLWGQLVKPQFTRSMGGGGWPEGWEYGRRAVLNMVEALWTVKSATGLDWWKELGLARDEAAYAMHFAWPSQKHVDDQGTIRAGTSLRPSAELMSGLATWLEAAGDSGADVARSFATDVVQQAGDDRTYWSKFLFGDPAAKQDNYRGQALSYFAAGPSHVAMRSAWDAGAVWGALSGGPYIDAPDSGEQLYGAGSLSVVVGDQPLLINPTGFLPQNSGKAGEDFVYADSYGKRERRLYNTFFVDDSTNPFNPGQNNHGPESSRAHVERYEDRGLFVHARATGLEDQYGSGSSHPVSQFTRDLVYLRPGSFVLFDRTQTARAGADQWLSFHTPVAARRVSTSDATSQRFEVDVGGATVGSISSLLPRGVTSSSVSLPGAASRLELHAVDGAAAQRWLTVVTAAGETGDQQRLSAADGNVASGNLVGVELEAPQAQVVLFANDQAAGGSVTSADYTVSSGAADHVIVDVEPGQGYGVKAVPSAGGLHIVVSPGGMLQASEQKTLSFHVAANGDVSPVGTSGAPSPDPSSPDPSSPDLGSTDPGASAPGSSGSPAAPTPAPEPATQPTPEPTAPGASPDPAPTPSPCTASLSGESTTSTCSGATVQTVSFTQGVDGYTGATDASISNLNYSAKNPTGTVYDAAEKLYAYALDYTAKTLIKFDLSSLPSAARVVAAKLDLTLESWVTPQTLLGYFLATPWDASSSAFGWLDGGAGQAWSTAGAGSGDAVGARFDLSGIDASGYQRRSLALDPARVQAWVASPSDNQGLLLFNSSAKRVLRLYASEAADVAKRPTLTVAYL